MKKHSNRILISIFMAIILIGCGNNNQDESAVAVDENASTYVEENASTNEIPSHWKKVESKDSFTDEVTKSYYVESNESSDHWFSVGCSRGGFLNFYVNYPKREGTPNMDTEVTVRIDSDPPFNEIWNVSWIFGSTPVKNPYQLLSKLQGKSKLAVEIFAATRNTYDIRGLESVVADMEATVCQFEDKVLEKELSLSELPRFGLSCKDDDIPHNFILVTDPSEQRLFFFREDDEEGFDVSTEIKLTNKFLRATVQVPGFSFIEQLEYDRKTGVLKRSWGSSYTAESKCEEIEESQYESWLAAAIAQHNEDLVKAQIKNQEQ